MPEPKHRLSEKQLEFLNSHELCRLATSSRDGMPQITPVLYVMDQDKPVIATDYGTKKLKNLKENPKVSLLVDDEDTTRGLMIQGECEIFERGEEYLRLLKILFEKIEYYRKNPWKEGESPILKIELTKVVDWNL